MILNSIYGDLALPEEPLVEFIFKRLEINGNKTALIDGVNGGSLTFLGILNQARFFAAYLHKYGLQKGDIIALVLPNCLQFIIITLGAAVCGVSVTTCNPSYTEREILSQFKHAEPKVLITTNLLSTSMSKLKEELTTLKAILTVDKSKNFKCIDECLNEGRKAEYPVVKLNEKTDIFLLPYSSGTTGLPKGVLLTHYCIKAALSINRNRWGYVTNDTLLTVLPTFHLYGIIGLLTTLVTGTLNVFGPKFTVTSFLQTIEKYKVTRFHAVPPMINELYNNRSMFNNFNTSSLRTFMCGAAPISDEVTNAVCRGLCCQMFQVYGMTEFTAIGIADAFCCASSTVGFVPPNTKVKILDIETGKQLDLNQVGEICAKGPQMMMGYYKNPVATARTIDKEGWIHTGDVGYFDKNQMLYVVDRIKELIKYKGFQIAPAELESVLLTNPNVKDVAVIGVPDKDVGERPKAFIIRRNQTCTAQEIHDYLIGKVSKFKYLSGGIEFVSQIPHSPSGKILRRYLRATSSNL